MTTETSPKGTSELKVLIIDDDPIFCKRLERVAAGEKIQLTTCTSVNDYRSLSHPLSYDILLLDYYIGETTAAEILHLFPPDFPIVLISDTGRQYPANTPWPKPITAFVSKKEGVFKVLKEAQEALGIRPVSSRTHRRLKLSHSYWALLPAIFSLALLFAYTSRVSKVEPPVATSPIVTRVPAPAAPAPQKKSLPSRPSRGIHWDGVKIKRFSQLAELRSNIGEREVGSGIETTMQIRN